MKKVAVCALLLTLAACGGAPPKPLAEAAPVTSSAGGQAAAQTQTADPKPDAAPTTPVQSAALPAESGGEQDQSAAKPGPAETPIPVNDDPAQFMEQSDEALRDALGDPAMIRRDGTAQVWQFRGDACTMDLFLYPNALGVLAVNHVELRGDGEEERRGCLARMLRDRILAADG